MKIAILSDARLPTATDYAGHGLGQVAITVANGLADCGQEVTLFAGVGSSFSKGKLITAADERDFLKHDLTAYSAVMDNTHGKVTRVIKGLPVIQVSHDRESSPNMQAVFPTITHARWHGFTKEQCRIVYNGVNVQEQTKKPRGEYFAYVSTFYPAKGAYSAMQAAQLAGVRLVMAGNTPPAPPPGADYIGPLAGDDKFSFLAGAKALLFPSAIEAAPLTVLEAQSVGCPVIVSCYGGAHENMQHELTGYAVGDTEEMAARIADIAKIERDACIEWVKENRSSQAMIAVYDDLLQRVAGGERW